MMYRRIRDLREDHDLKQREIAQIVCCACRTYSAYETGSRQIPTDILIRLAKYYNTSVDYLLGLTDQKPPYPRVPTP